MRRKRGQALTSTETHSCCRVHAQSHLHVYYSLCQLMERLHVLETNSTLLGGRNIQSNHTENFLRGNQLSYGTITLTTLISSLPTHTTSSLSSTPPTTTPSLPPHPREEKVSCHTSSSHACSTSSSSGCSWWHRRGSSD